MALLLLTVTASAQVRTITGSVKDEQGAGIPNVSIQVKGSKTTVLGDGSGSFRISASDNQTIVVSAVGFNNSEIKVGTLSAFNITLSRKTNELENVVVTAQGIRKKAKDIGYSYATVSNNDISVGRAPQLTQALSGKVSGLAI